MYWLQKRLQCYWFILLEELFLLEQDVNSWFFFFFYRRTHGTNRWLSPITNRLYSDSSALSLRVGYLQCSQRKAAGWIMDRWRNWKMKRAEIRYDRNIAKQKARQSQRNRRALVWFEA